MVAPDRVARPSPEGAGRRAGRSGRATGSTIDAGRRRVRVAISGLVLVATAALAALGYRALHGGPADPEALWWQAQDDLRGGRLDRAEQAVARLSQLREPTPPDRMLRGQVALGLGRPAEALAELARVPDAHGLAAQCRLLAGKIELRRDRFRAAEEALREAIRLDPGLIPAHRELIYIYGFQLRRAEVCGEFLALSELTDLSFSELLDWGQLRSESWEPSAAAEALARCIAADPSDRWSRLALSENQRRMGLLDQAEVTLTGLADDDPSSIAARARIALERNDEPEAERLLGSGPSDDPELARLRGRLALSRRDAAAAARHFRIAHRTEPESQEGLSGLIAALKILGDARALEPLRDLAARRDRLDRLIRRAASEASRDEPELPLRLGEACAALGRDAEARGWYKLAIARDPLDSQAQRALFRLGAARVGSPAPRPGR